MSQMANLELWLLQVAHIRYSILSSVICFVEASAIEDEVNVVRIDRDQSRNYCDSHTIIVYYLQLH